MRFLILCLFACVSACAQIVPPRQTWQVETSKNLVRPLDLRYGETIDIEVCLLNYGTAIDLSAATNIVLHAQTNGMDGASFQLSGSKGRRGAEADAALGWVWVRVPVDSWLPDLTGATASYALEASDGTTRILRTSGPLRVSGNAAAAAGQALPPLALQSVMATASNALAAAQAATIASSNAQSTAEGKLGPTDYAPYLLAKYAMDTNHLVVSGSGYANANGSYWRASSSADTPQAFTNYISAIWTDTNNVAVLMADDMTMFVCSNGLFGTWQELFPGSFGAAPSSVAYYVDSLMLSNLVEAVTDAAGRIQTLESRPAFPTNYIAGWTMYDHGSNVWFNFSITNFAVFGDVVQ